MGFSVQPRPACHYTVSPLWDRHPPLLGTLQSMSLLTVDKRRLGKVDPLLPRGSVSSDQECNHVLISLCPVVSYSIIVSSLPMDQMVIAAFNCQDAYGHDSVLALHRKRKAKVQHAGRLAMQGLSVQVGGICTQKSLLTGQRG